MVRKAVSQAVDAFSLGTSAGRVFRPAWELVCFPGFGGIAGFTLSPLRCFATGNPSSVVSQNLLSRTRCVDNGSVDGVDVIFPLPDDFGRNVGRVAFAVIDAGHSGIRRSKKCRVWSRGSRGLYLNRMYDREMTSSVQCTLLWIDKNRRLMRDGPTLYNLPEISW